MKIGDLVILETCEFGVGIILDIEDLSHYEKSLRTMLVHFTNDPLRKPQWYFEDELRTPPKSLKSLKKYD